MDSRVPFHGLPQEMDGRLLDQEPPQVKLPLKHLTALAKRGRLIRGYDLKVVSLQVSFLKRFSRVVPSASDCTKRK